MDKLDLHGLKHRDAELQVERFLADCNLPCKIITGNSERMRSLVTNQCKRYGLYIWDTGNYGCLTILEKKL